MSLAMLAMLIPGKDPIATFVVVAGVLVLSAWYSGAETGLYQLNRIHLRMRALEGNRRAQILSSLLTDQQAFICTLLIGTNWTNYLATMLVTAYCSSGSLSDQQAEVITTLTLAPVIFIFAETVPKNWFYHQANRLMYSSAALIRLNILVLRFTGIIYLFKGLNWLVLRTAGAWTDVRQILLSGHDLGHLLREGHAAGALTAVQSDIAQRILRLPETSIGSVMVSIWRAAAIPEDISRDQFLELIKEHNYSRLPVYRGQPNNVIGLVNVYHVLSSPKQQPAEHIIPTVRISPRDTIMPVLYKLQRQHNPMAIVVNDQGQAIGIVTIKDLVEEVVGELGQW